MNNIERQSINPKSRNLNWYLQEIENMEWVEFDKLVPWTTAGDIRPPYPYQWQALTKPRPGDDDPFEGIGGTPLEAVRDLYHSLIKATQFQEEDED